MLYQKYRVIKSAPLSTVLLLFIVTIISTPSFGFDFTPNEREFRSWSVRCQVEYLGTNIGLLSPFTGMLSKDQTSHYRPNHEGGPWHFCKSKIILKRARNEFDETKSKKLYREAQKEANYTYTRMSTDNPWIAEVAVTLGEIFKGLGDLKRAEKYYLRAIELQPSYTQGYSALALFYRTNGRLEEAISVLTVGVEKAKGVDAELFYLLGLLSLENDQLDNAKLYADKAYAQGYPLPGLRIKLNKFRE